MSHKARKSSFGDEPHEAEENLNPKCRHPNIGNPWWLDCPECRQPVRFDRWRNGESHRLRNALQAALTWLEMGHRPTPEELDRLRELAKPVHPDRTSLAHIIEIFTTEDEIRVRLHDELGPRFGIVSPWTAGNRESLRNTLYVALQETADSVVAHVTVAQAFANDPTIRGGVNGPVVG